MSKKIYTCERSIYEDSRRKIINEDGGQWFFQKMGIEVKDEKEIKVRDHMERCRIVH